MPDYPNIIFDAERMKYPFTGLHTYCYYLGNSIKNKPYSRHQNLSFYLPENKFGVFGNDVHYIKQNPLHKFYFPVKSKNAIWHNTYQNTNYLPESPKIPVLLTIHDLNFMYDSSKSTAKKRSYLKKLQDTVNRSAHIAVISKSTLKDAEQHLDLGGKEVSIIYNGCSIKAFENLTPPLFKPDREFIFTVGTIVPKKNFHVLPAMLKYNDMQLVIAGVTHSAAYRNLIISEAEKHGVKDRVIFTGSVSENDKQWYYKHCKLFAFPSISEGFGLPVVEAMSFGKPVILSTLTSLPEIGGDVAYYFDSFEPSVMQDNLTAALHDFETTDRTGSLIARSKQFNWDNAATDFINVYEKIRTRYL